MIGAIVAVALLCGVVVAAVIAIRHWMLNSPLPPRRPSLDRDPALDRQAADAQRWARSRPHASVSNPPPGPTGPGGPRQPRPTPVNGHCPTGEDVNRVSDWLDREP